MPLTAIIQTASSSARVVLRKPGAANKYCSHGFSTSRQTSDLARSQLKNHLLWETGSTSSHPSPSHHIASPPHRPSPGSMRLFSHKTTTRTILGLLPLSSLARAGSGVHAPKHCRTHATYGQELEEMLVGNKEFRARIATTNPGLLEDLAIEGQRPPFMVLDCSDSRVSEQAIFSAKPGTMFTAGNIANQFLEEDVTSNAVLSYAVETLAVKHVVVMGHYGCGGIAASMLPLTEPPTHPAHIAVQTWIKPIREIYAQSTRPEIVAHREKSKRTPSEELPHLHDPAFRALVQENVKANVQRIAQSAVMKDHYASRAQARIQRSNNPSAPLLATDVYIHGWVYDVENGEVLDLRVSIGPPGKGVPPSPFPSVSS